MAILPSVLETAFYEEIRDKIAEILLLEVPAQGVLLSDPLISGIDKVYVERSIPFSSESIPAINVIFEKVDFGDETQVGKQFTAEYAVDIYGMAQTTPVQRADEKANKWVQKLAALVDGIISYGGYVRLGFGIPTVSEPKGVSNRKVYDIQFFNPESEKNAETIVRARVRIRVTGNQPKLEVAPRPLQGADTQVVLFDSNESYFYTNDEVIPPVVTDPCEPVIVQNSDGSYEVSQLAGTTLTLSDTTVNILNTLGTVLDSVDVVSVTGGDITMPNITITDSTGVIVNHPAGVDFVCTPNVACTGIGNYNGYDPHYTLPSNNYWGHTFRLCGMTGGYTDGVGYFDVNGVATTKAIAFPDGIICDLYRVTCDGDFLMLQDDCNLTTNVTYAVAESFCTSFSLGGFSDWYVMTRKNFEQVVLYDDISNIFSYPPFENTLATNLWTSTPLFFGGTYDRHWLITQYQGDSFAFKTAASARAFPVRIGNISEF